VKPNLNEHWQVYKEIIYLHKFNEEKWSHPINEWRDIATQLIFKLFS
jgi:hypothetical protein